MAVPPPPKPFEGAGDRPQRQTGAKRRRLCIAKSPALAPQSPDGTDAGRWWTADQLAPGSARRFALDQLRQYVADFEGSEADEFWHRKSGKSVLSVVVCKGKDGGFNAYRGLNTEVSLPAGSLCAERAAIGQAASNFQRASDIVVVATVDPQDKLNPLWPCEVCQSWLGKLRAQSPDISVVAVASPACDRFAVRINGETEPPPLPLLHSPAGTCSWRQRVALADGTDDPPWDAKETVYVDGAWAFMHSAHQHILKVARMRGTHLLVGVHSDEVIEKECGRPTMECYNTRLERVAQNRYVCSVLHSAPWALTKEMLSSLGVKRVITGSVDKSRDGGSENEGLDPYAAARELNILEVVSSLDATTESSFHLARVARAAHAGLESP